MEGLYSKYVITKADGSPVDPNAQYFVLRLDTDPAARMAMLTYADEVEKDNPQLSGELRVALKPMDGTLTDTGKIELYEDAIDAAINHIWSHVVRHGQGQGWTPELLDAFVALRMVRDPIDVPDVAADVMDASEDDDLTDGER